MDFPHGQITNKYHGATRYHTLFTSSNKMTHRIRRFQLIAKQKMSTKKIWANHRLIDNANIKLNKKYRGFPMFSAHAPEMESTHVWGVPRGCGESALASFHWSCYAHRLSWGNNSNFKTQQWTPTSRMMHLFLVHFCYRNGRSKLGYSDSFQQKNESIMGEFQEKPEILSPT